MSTVIDTIRSRGRWDVALRPVPYEENRVAYDQLEHVIATATVRLRGWPVPFVDYRDEFIRHDDFVGQDIDAHVVGHYEAWRFFTSGQFTQLRSFSADWDSDRPNVPEGFSSVIQVWEILYYITEIFELGSRLMLGGVGGDGMTFDVSLDGLDGRGLIVGQSNRAPFMTPHRASASTLRQTVTISRDELVAEGHARAVDLAREFFLRFGWNPPTDQLAAHQLELLEGR